MLVFLPTLDDCAAAPSAKWRALVAEQAAELDVDLIDVVAELQQLPAVEAVDLFILPGAYDPAATDHFNERGNAFTAEVVYRHLRQSPRLAEALGLGKPPAESP